MRDIASLKQRIESAEKHNASTEIARNRESEALLDMWHKIRTRFSDQEDEIARYRTRLEEMTQKNSELGLMVDELLATVEGNLDRARDETVPRITDMAEELLASEPLPLAGNGQSTTQMSEQPVSASEENPSSSFDDALMAVSSFNDEPEPEPETDAELQENSVPDPDVVRSVLDLISNADDGDLAGNDDSHNDHDGGNDFSKPAATESLSEGIRDIISRVESMSAGVETPMEAAAPVEMAPPLESQESTDAPEPIPANDEDAKSDEFLSELLGALKTVDQEPEPATEQDDALDQELREIESLRNELSGLRDRLSTGSGKV